MACTLLLKEVLANLSGAERRLADHLLAHPQQVVHMNAREYAEICGCSPATVVRFAQGLGFPGFTELKLDLARESPLEEMDDFQSVIRDNDDMATIVYKAQRIHLRNVSLTYGMLNVPMLSQAVEAICACRRIHLFGVGASGLLAMDFLHKASRIGLPATYHADAHTNLAAVSLLGPEDMVIAISYSGETKETVLAARAAKERGAGLITITQANRNALSRLADYPFFVPAEEKELRVGAMTSRNSCSLILDLLYLGIAKHEPDRVEENLRQTLELIRTFQRS